MVIFGSYDCHMYALDAKRGKEVWRFQTSSKVQSSVDITEQVIVKPEFMGKKEGEVETEEKYEFVPQLDVSESTYTPIIEYAVKDIYGTSKKKYEETV